MTDSVGSRRGPDRPAVTVIVPTYRDWPRLALCLGSLAAQTYPADRLEIVVVNNDGEEPPPDDLPALPNCRILSEPKKGSYAARNAGLAAATGDIVLFTDSDCIADPGWVGAAVGFLTAHPGTPRMGGRIAIAARPGGPTVADVYEAAFAFPQERYVSRGWSPTANMGTWRRLFDAVGPFDEAHYSGGDSDWGRRAAEAGHAIGYCPDAVVTHPPRTLSEILTKRRRIGGARLNREIAEQGRGRIMLRFVPKALRRLLPPTKAIRPLLRLKDMPAGLRWKAYFFIYYLRLDNEVSRARVLFFNAEPERR